jgi:hypothetical protein
MEQPALNPPGVPDPDLQIANSAHGPSEEGPVAVPPARVDSTFVAKEPFGPDTVPFEIYNSTDPKYMARLFMPAGKRRNNTNICNTGIRPNRRFPSSFSTLFSNVYLNFQKQHKEEGQGGRDRAGQGGKDICSDKDTVSYLRCVCLVVLLAS